MFRCDAVFFRKINSIKEKSYGKAAVNYNKVSGLLQLHGSDKRSRPLLRNKEIPEACAQHTLPVCIIQIDSSCLRQPKPFLKKRFWNPKNFKKFLKVNAQLLKTTKLYVIIVPSSAPGFRWVSMCCCTYSLGDAEVPTQYFRRRFFRPAERTTVFTFVLF